jgi:hypothetical protein
MPGTPPKVARYRFGPFELDPEGPGRFEAQMVVLARWLKDESRALEALKRRA